jgi:hypothetical protein
MDTSRIITDEDTNYHISGKSKYRCRFCAHEQDKKCLAKPGKKNIKLNKKRNNCKKYEFDNEKFTSYELGRRPIKIERRPDWFWMTNKQKKRLAELLQGAMVTPPAHLQRNIVTPQDSDKLIWTPGDGVDEA